MNKRVLSLVSLCLLLEECFQWVALAAVPVVTNIANFPSVSVAYTNYSSEVIVTNGITLGGVRNTAWPAGGGASDWTNLSNAFQPIAAHTNYFLGADIFASGTNNGQNITLLGNRAAYQAIFDSATHDVFGAGFYPFRASVLQGASDVSAIGQNSLATSYLTNVADTHGWGNYALFGLAATNSSNIYGKGHSAGQGVTATASGNLFFDGNETGLGSYFTNVTDMSLFNGAMKNATISDSHNFGAFGIDALSGFTGSLTNVFYFATNMNIYAGGAFFGGKDAQADSITTFSDGGQGWIPDVGFFTRTNLALVFGTGLNGSMFYNGSGMFGNFATNGFYYQVGCDRADFYGPVMSIQGAPAMDPGAPNNYYGTTNAVASFVVQDQDAVYYAGRFSVNLTKYGSTSYPAMIWAYPSPEMASPNLLALGSVPDYSGSGYPPNVFLVSTNGDMTASGFMAAGTTNRWQTGDYVTGGKISIGVNNTNYNLLTDKAVAAIAPVSLSYGAGGTNIVTDASLGNHFRLTATNTLFLANPINPTDGQKIIWEIIQDGVGSRTATEDTEFAFGTDITGITLTTTASKRDFITAVYNSTATKWFVTGFVRGY